MAKPKTSKRGGRTPERLVISDPEQGLRRLLKMESAATVCEKCGAPVKPEIREDTAVYECAACGYTKATFLTEEAGQRAAERLQELVEGRYEKRPGKREPN